MADDEDLERLADELSRDEAPTARAIKSLIEVKKPLAGEDSEIELKTDISDDEQKIHAILSILSQAITKPDMMAGECILSPVINKLQRLALSKSRKSREEIVAVARQPDMNMLGLPPPEQGMVRSFFSSRRNRVN